MYTLTLGADVGLGDGYNTQFNNFVKFEGVSNLVESKTDKSLFHEECRDTRQQFWLAELLQDSVQRLADFEIVRAQPNFYGFFMRVTTTEKTCEKVKHVKTTDCYVKAIKYGMFLHVFVQKAGFPDKKTDMDVVLASAMKDVNLLTEDQKHAKCSVLINTTETREMTMETLLKFAREFMDEHHSEYTTVIGVTLVKNDIIPSIESPNFDDFESFVNQLYVCYRCLELKLEKAKYPGLIGKPEEQLSIIPMSQLLIRAKKDFEKADKSDFFALYPVLKTLFWRYRDYLKVVIEKGLDLDEGSFLPKGSMYLNSLFDKMAKWIPIEVGGRWYGTSKDMLLIPGKEFESVKSKISELRKKIIVKEDADLKEPVLVDLKYQINGLFGWVDMSGADTSTEIPQTTPLEVKCPQTNCSDAVRKWICSGCGNVVKCHQIYLVCSGCGSILFDKQSFVCNSPSHPSEFFTHLTAEDDDSSASVNMEGNSDSPMDSGSEKSYICI